MPLPLKRLMGVVKWLEVNSEDVIHDTIKNSKPGEIPNPLVLVTRVLGKVNVSKIALDIFTYPKDPETREPINKGLDERFFDDYLTIPTAHKLVNEFVEMNDLPNLIKNLQSLPVIKKITEAMQLTFGIPYLNFLQQSTGSTQGKSEGSHSLKSTDISTHSTIAETVFGQEQKSEETETKKSVVM